MSRDGKEGREDARRATASSSYLVRVWQEAGADGEARFYLRDLRTGEELYSGDPGRIGALLTRGISADKPALPRRNSA